MNMFGLGVVLNVTDNMSTGFVNVMNTFNQFENRMNSLVNATANGMSQFEAELNKAQNLSFLGFGVQQLGNQIAGVGTSMLQPFVNFGTQVTQTGAQFENYRLTLKALYGDVGKATEVTNQAMDLAAKTPFQISDVMKSVVGFKAIGVEALDTMEHLTGESRTLLEYIGDLASLRPDIGLDGMLYGIRNLLGGDGGRSLRSRLDMDFEQMLGFEWADTTEGMIEQIVYASQQVANGLMKEMEGSWQHMTSNIEDQWDKVKLSVSDAGAFDSVKNTLKYFYDVVDSIDDEKMARIGENIAGAFNMIWKPIDFVARKLSDVFNWVVNLVAESPTLTKFVTGFTAVAGAVLVAVGAMTVLGGSVLLAVAGFKGLQLMFTKLPTFIMGLAPKLLSLATVLGKYALIGGALYLAWKNDFMGVRTILQNFMNNVSTAFKESARISQLGVTDMMSALKQLDTTTFGGWLTYRLTQIRVFWMALVDAWNDNTLSDENFQKVQALGLLPLLETILDLKMKAEAFFEGFKRGFENVANVVVPIVTTICDWIGKIWKPLLETILDLKMKAEAFFEGFKRGFENVANVVVPIVTTICDWIGKIWNFLFPINDEVDEFNESGKSLDLKPWEDLGEMLSYVVSGIAGLFVVSKVIGAFTLVGKAIGTVISFVGKIPQWEDLGEMLSYVVSGIAGLFVVSKVIGAFTLVGKAIGTVISFVGKIPQFFMSVMSFLGTKVLGPILAGIGTVVTAILGACGIIISAPAWVVGAITVAVLALVAFIVTKWDEIKEVTLKMLNNVKDWFIEKWGQIKEWYNNNIVPLIEQIKTKWNECITYLGDKFTQVKNWFIEKWSQIKSWYNNNIQPLIDSIVSSWNDTKQKFCDTITNIKDWFIEKWSDIKKWYNNNIQPLIDNIVSKWNEVKQKFCDVITGIKDWFIEKWGEIVQWYNTNIKPWVDIVAKIFEIAYQLIRASILLTCQWFKDKWNDIKKWYNSTIKTWIDKAVQWWEEFKTSVHDKIESIRQWFVDKWGAIKDWYNTTIQTWVKEVSQWWEEFKTSINNTIDTIKNWFINKWEELKNWYDSTIQPWINAVISLWENFKTNLAILIANLKDIFIQKWLELKNWYQETIVPWIDKVVTLWNDFKTNVSNFITNVKDTFVQKWGEIKDWYQGTIQPWIDKVQGVWDTFASKVSGVWDTISSAWRSTIGTLYTWVAEKVNAMIDLVNKVPFVNIDKISTEMPVPKPKVGLATGGFVKDEGVAMLHPNEVVNNDDLTSKLRVFLNENAKNEPSVAKGIVNNVTNEDITNNNLVSQVNTRNNTNNNNYLSRTLNTNNNYMDSISNTYNTNNSSDSNKVYNIYNTTESGTEMDVKPLEKVLVRFVDTVTTFFANPLELVTPEFSYPVPQNMVVSTPEENEEEQTPIPLNLGDYQGGNNTNNVLELVTPEFSYPVPQNMVVSTPEENEEEQTPIPLNLGDYQGGNNTNNVYNNMTSTLAHTTNKTNNQNSVSNDYSVTFDKGSIQITVENGNDTDVEQIAQKIMQKIKRQQQLESTRNYKPLF